MKICFIHTVDTPDHVVQKLLDIKWWDWSEEKIKANKDFFMTNLEESSEDDFSKFMK